MDWNLAIEKNREALMRILAMLVAMVSMSADPNSGARQATLPRHLHRYILRLLRPAEAATRRLIIVCARGLVVKIPPLRARKPKAQPRTILVLDRVNGSIVSVPIVLPEQVRPEAKPRKPSLSFPLLDPFIGFGVRRRYVNPGAAPRISLIADDPHMPQFLRPSHLPAPSGPPSADDQLDASHLHRRLDVVASALQDLPGQAKRLARWQARGEAIRAQRQILAAEATKVADTSGAPSSGRNFRRFRRFSPMRPGRPPGWRRKANHEIYEVLNELHGLAVWARESPNTS